MPGFKAELRSAVIDEVVFGIESAVDELGILVGICPKVPRRRSTSGT